MVKPRIAKHVHWIPLSDIRHADENPREAARSLLENGYEIFPKRASKEKSLWSLATGSNVERAKFAKLMEDHEPDICALGRTYLISGQLQAIQIRPVDGGYAVVCGLRRCLAWLYIRASAGDKIGEVQATIEDITPEESANRAVIENVHRKAHEQIELAKVIMRRINMGDTVAEIANSLGMSSGSVNNYYEVAQASPEVQLAVQQGDLNLGEARKIVKEVKNGVPEKQARKKIEKERDQQYKPRGSRRVLMAYGDVLELYCKQTNGQIRRVIAQILQLTFEEAEEIRKNMQKVSLQMNDEQQRRLA